MAIRPQDRQQPRRQDQQVPEDLRTRGRRSPGGGSPRHRPDSPHPMSDRDPNMEGPRTTIPIRARLGARPVRPWTDGNLPRNYHVPFRTTVRSPAHDWNPWGENQRPRSSEYPREIWRESARNVYQPEGGQYLYSPVHSTYRSPTRSRTERQDPLDNRVAVNFDDYVLDDEDDGAANTVNNDAGQIKPDSERASDYGDDRQ